MLLEKCPNTKLSKKIIVGAKIILKHLDFNLFCLLDLWKEILKTRLTTLRDKTKNINSAT